MITLKYLSYSIRLLQMNFIIIFQVLIKPIEILTGSVFNL